MTTERTELAIVGGGLAGNLMAILLARRGLKPIVVERGPAHDAADAPAGRTINLALAARGIAALDAAGVFADVEPLLIPMAGRIVHDEQGATRFLAYGQRDDEQIYSVSRSELNRKLYRLARNGHGVEYRFGHECVGVDLAGPGIELKSAAGRQHLRARLIVAADGAGSVVRNALAADGKLTASEELLDHGYKELTLPATATGEFALAENGLHIWPRGGYMLIALPNVDRSFTATLFLPSTGSSSFERVGPKDAADFFAREFPDALPLIPDIERQFAEHPVGLLGSVHCRPWHYTETGDESSSVLLLGDAAHAIVPFHGQGLNAAFEDCAELDRLVGSHGPDWPEILPLFVERRYDNVRAIAEMALENYLEMRDEVRDPAFEIKRSLSFELERRYEGRFIPRYSMVMFHPEIGYAEAQRRGRIQNDILTRATSRFDDDGRVDMPLAERLVEQLL